jgi:hypothetical protein
MVVRNHRLGNSNEIRVMIALVVCGCIFTRKRRKKLLTDTAQPAATDEYRPGCFAIEEERGGNWKGSGGIPPLKKLGLVFDGRGCSHAQARRIAANIVKLPAAEQEGQQIKKAASLQRSVQRQRFLVEL